MSNRPRRHQIEGQSQIAFQARLPSQWLYRPITPDYGIDGSVEIFDEIGHRTGKLFSVQLKATDEANLTKALAIRLDTDTCDYYRSLDTPILIVRFHVPTGRLFAKWFHLFDPYPAKRGKKTVTFRLAESDEWAENTASALLVVVDMIRRLRSGTLPLPVPFSLKIVEDSIHGISSAEVSLNLRKAAQALPGVLTFDGDPDSPWGVITVSSTSVLVTLAGFKRFTLHFKKAYPLDLMKRSFCGDVLVAVALTLDSAGYPSLGANLLAEFGSQSSLLSNPEVAIWVALCMARARRLTEALRLAEDLLANKRSRLAVFALITTIRTKAPAMSTDERELLKYVLTRHTEAEEKIGDSRAAAASNYNLGNHLRWLSAPRAAFARYRKAAKLDPRYLERGYFCREMAGVLFGMGRYRAASRLYASALRMGEKGFTRALLADALMFSGNYADALREFDAYLSAEKEPKSEYVLKSWALKGQQRMLKLAHQQREQLAALRLSTPEADAPTPDFVKQLERALELDALCGFAWFNLGKCLADQGKTDDALIAFLWAALVEIGDAEAWANAFALSTFSGQYRDLAPRIAMAARHATREKFMEQILKNAEAQAPGFPKEEYLAAVTDLLAHIPREEPKFELRLYNDIGIAHIVNI